jgi:hypothetical protein
VARAFFAAGNAGADVEQPLAFDILRAAFGVGIVGVAAVDKDVALGEEGEAVIDDIVAAIRLAWQMDPSHKNDSLQIKYHPPTNLLLVTGTPASLEVVERVIDSLKPLATTKAKPDSTSTPSAPSR